MNEAAKGQINIARVIFIGLLIGQFLFYFFIQYILKGRANLFNEEFAQHWLYYILPLLTFGGFFLAIQYGKNRKKKFLTIKDETAQASFYRETSIMQGAIMEMANLYAIISALLTFSLLPFMFFAVGLVMFLFFFPTENKYRNFESE